MRVSRIPAPPEMPLPYRRVYWANWWALVKKRKPPHKDAIGTCIGCERKGILGYELIHRGSTRPTNLMCDACDVAGGMRVETIGFGKKVPDRGRPTGDRTKVVRKRRLPRS